MSSAQSSGSTAVAPAEGEERELVSPLTALRRHWVVGTALVLVGTGVGAATGVLLPDSYTSESRIAVGSNDLAALSVPGYSFAAQELAASTARYVDNSQALGALEPVLGRDSEAVTDVAASPIPQSNIIRVEVTADNEAVATRGAAVITDYLLEQANRVNSSSDGDALLTEYADLSQQVAEVSAALDDAERASESAGGILPSTAPVRAQAVDLSAQLDVLERRQMAVGEQYEDAVTSDDLAYQLVTVLEAAPSFDNASSQVQRYGLLGLVVGVLAALLSAVLLERRARRTPRPSTATSGEDPFRGLGQADDTSDVDRLSTEPAPTGRP
ncbi:hypothetical protein [uncultured Pseudokineococcus sp.]|uniref:hypothetical protein n=1 Tax=uncultured Pseudokineococcus sp. TaxID=1642928 RepID=UPI0026306DEE|nr:hypothetical protein [uncultured Pseudokineococcus sp.]